MAYVNDKKDPELIFKIDEFSEMAEVRAIERMVETMNQELIDSGFDQYQFRVEYDQNKAYIRRTA
jgi:hypothetical protein